MEGYKGTDDLRTVSEDIGLPTPPSPGRVPPPNLPPADPREGDLGGERPVPTPPGDEA